MGKTFDFDVGLGQVIRGWDEGMVGLCVGARATLIVPSLFGYMDGATRQFDVDIVGVNRPADSPPDLFRALDRDASGILEMDEMQFFWHAQGQQMPPNLVETYDKNGDNQLSCEEVCTCFQNLPKGMRSCHRSLVFSALSRSPYLLRAWRSLTDQRCVRRAA